MTPTSYALLGVCAATAAGLLLLLALRPGWRRRGGMLRLSIAGGVSATASSLMYLVYSATANPAALITGDVAMVLAPGLVYLGLGVPGGRMAVRIVVVMTAATVVGITSGAVALPASLAVKAIVIALLCGLGAAATRHPALAQRRGTLLTALSLGVYGAFSLARVVVGLTAGWGSALYQGGFTIVPTSVVGGLTVLALGVATVLLVSDGALSPGEISGSRAGRPDDPYTWAMSLRNLALVRTALGVTRTVRMSTDLLDAARTIDPDAYVSAGEVRIRADLDARDLDGPLRDLLGRQGWSPGEISLVSMMRRDPAD